MSPVADTLRRLRVAIGGCALLLSVAAVLAALAWDRTGDLERLAEDERRTRLSNRAMLDEMRAQADRLRRFAARHEALAGAGLGGFSATHEVDRLDRIADALGGPAGPAIDSYVLRARVPVPESLDTGMTGHRVSMQPLEFESTLPHEDAFLQVWTALAEGLGGLRGIEACTLGLAGAWPARSDGAEGLSAPRLKARCTLQWYVLEPREDGGAPGAPSAPDVARIETGGSAAAGRAARAAGALARSPRGSDEVAALTHALTHARAATVPAGRLFFTPAERARIDASLRAAAPPRDAVGAGAGVAADTPPRGPLRIDGLMRDATGATIVWIDGEPRAVGGVAPGRLAGMPVGADATDAPGAELRTALGPDGLSVRVRRAGEPERELRPGQSTEGPELGPGNRIEVIR